MALVVGHRLYWSMDAVGFTSTLLQWVSFIPSVELLISSTKKGAELKKWLFLRALKLCDITHLLPPSQLLPLTANFIK